MIGRRRRAHRVSRGARADALAMAVLQRLAAHLTFEAPDAEGFVPVSGRLSPGAVAALAALGAEVEDMEPSLGSLGQGAPTDQTNWSAGAGVRPGEVVDGEPDAGEEREEDPADPSVTGLGDDSEHGIADQDAAVLFWEEVDAFKAFQPSYEERRIGHWKALLLIDEHPQTAARFRFGMPLRYI